MNVLAVIRTLGLMVLGIVLFVAMLSIVQYPLKSRHVPDYAAVIVIVAVAFGFYVGWARIVERRVPIELAPRALLEAPQGFVLGVALFSLVIGLLALSGAFSVRAGDGWHGLGSVLLTTFAAAIAEEIVFRAWLFRTVRSLWGTWIAVAISAVVFGALHAFNPAASLVSTVAITLEAGVLLALAYALTNRLWMPIGLHLGWNISEGFIYGTAVSGNVPAHALMHGALRGPAILTGGSFGPEGSVFSLLVCLLAAAVFGMQVWRRDQKGVDRGSRQRIDPGSL